MPKGWPLIAAGVALAAGIGHVSWLITEHARHPEWSAPAWVNAVYLIPYTVIAAALVGVHLWRAHRGL